MKTISQYCIYVFFFLSATLAFASDHIDGAPTLTNGQADLTDLYAFPSPHDPENLTLILNTYPGVSRKGHFSKKVKYQLQMRPLALNTPEKFGFKVFNFDVLTLDCSFTDPAHHHWNPLKQSEESKVHCQLKKDGQLLTELYGSVGETLKNDSLKIFTGPRTDSFFLSVPHFQGVTKREGFPEADDQLQNAMYSLNILSIVAELDLESLDLDPALLGISAQSLDSESEQGIDRVGRPEITNLSLHAFDGAEKLKRFYNKLPPFAVSEKQKQVYQQRMIENIAAYDQFDNNEDWNEADLEKLTHLLSNDFLVIDLSQSCQKDSQSYLSIEKSLLGDPTAETCGGRYPQEDIMAYMMALYIGGTHTPFQEYSSGVNVPYKNNESAALSENFPYLPPPSKTSLKQKALLQLLIFAQE